MHVSDVSKPAFTLSWGSGASRHVIDTDSPALCAALVGRSGFADDREFLEYIQTKTGRSPAESRELLGFLNSYGFFQAESPSDYYANWLQLGWHDALAIHHATADARWVHDYRGAPQVMVRESTNEPVLPSEPRPTPAYAEGGTRIPLPEPEPLESSYRDYLSKRRTRRNFDGTTVTLQDLGSIARWTLSRNHLPDRRFISPTYIDDGPYLGYFALDTAQVDFATGATRRFAFYGYRPDDHCLVLISETDDMTGWSDLLWTQTYAEGAPLLLILAADLPQFMWKYRTGRAYRWVFSEIGSFMHTAGAVATARGLKVFQTPAIDDAAVCEALRVDPVRTLPLYVAAVGRAR